MSVVRASTACRPSPIIHWPNPATLGAVHCASLLPQFRMQFQRSPTPHQCRFLRIPTIRFQTMKHIRGNCMRNCWAAGPGRATSGRPTLQTSSNQRNFNRLVRTSVTNVVNLSQKTTIFSQKAIGLTTFVTTGQKSTRKTPPIDDVCNNTHRGIPKSQHDEADHIRRTGGHGWGAHGRRQGLARQRANAPIHTSATKCRR